MDTMIADRRFTDVGVLPCRLDEGIASRAAIGLLVLATDQTMEHEFRHLLRQDGVAFFESRLYNENAITPETLRAMGSQIAPCADLILPGMPLDVVAFGCTSASMTLGEEAVFAERSTRCGQASPARPRSPPPSPRSRRWMRIASAC